MKKNFLIRFTATIRQFNAQGEKTGWTYIEIPADLADKLKPGNRKTFRVKGRLDKHVIVGVALLPMGGGKFIMALNEAMRKGTGKRKGARLDVQLAADDEFSIQVNPEFLECMQDEPRALTFFNSLPKSHRDYFTKWIESAKTEPTKTKRIAKAVSALSRQMGYGEMLRDLKKQKDETRG